MKTYNHIKIGVLISVLFSLFCFSCNNFFQPPKPEKSTEGKGYVSLSIGGVQVGRTILPQATANDFYGYKLELVNIRTGVSLDSLFLTKDTLTQPIPLDAGKYHLTVTACMDSEYKKPAASASLDIAINPNSTTTIPVTLKANIEEKGKGTFRWDITYDADITVDTAEMIITRFTKDGEVPAYNNNAIAQQSSIELDAGYYRVVIKLSRDNGEETAELREILHIYSNMESGVFNPVITNNHFTRAIYVTNGNDDGPGSLRWAIGQAKLRENSTIIIDSSVKTITLTSDSLAITDYSGLTTINLTIEGNGVTITQNSPTEFRLLYAAGVDITIRRVHFKGGKNFDFEGSGGAIYNSATLTLESCIFSENQAAYSGGAICNYNATMDIKGCTFYGNSAVGNGWQGYCGAIYNYGGSLSLTGNLFYGNTAFSYYPVINSSISDGYNVVDVQLGDDTNQSGWDPAASDQYIPGPTVMPKTFKLISGTDAANVFIDALPANYPAIDFYGNPITLGAAAGAVQEEVNACIVTFDTGYPRIKISPVVVEHGDKIEKPGDPDRYDNTFEGWYTEGGLAWNFDINKAPNVTALTLNARWQHDPLIFSDLAERLTEFLENARSNNGPTSITINVEDDGYIAPLELYSYSSAKVTITLRSKDPTNKKTISLGEKGSMFTIRENVTLILENITLQGHRYNTAPLVSVSWDGNLFMENGSTITGNTNTSESEYPSCGGGVLVGPWSTFTMNGGTISGNEAYYGGGVYVYGTTENDSTLQGTFKMSGNAQISGNIANSGGGVYVNSSGLFEMKGGTISGNEATSDGVDEGGGGVYFKSGLSTFSMTNGTVYGNETEIEEELKNKAKNGAAVYGGSNTTNDTIKKVDGIRTFDVKSIRQWTAARDQIISDDGGYVSSIKDYVINVVDSFAVAGSTSPTFGNVQYIKVTITTEDNKTLTLSSQGSLLIIGNQQTVILEDVNLVGYGDPYDPVTDLYWDNGDYNDFSLVHIGGNGSFTMQGSASVSGNTTISAGGGVFVEGTNSTIATFTMKDNATVSGNTAMGDGGGVYVLSTNPTSFTTFTMQDKASVSGNTTSESGGGVYVTGSKGKFTMSGGTISDNNADKDSGYGGGVLVLDGTFTMSGNAVVSGNEAFDGGGVCVEDGTFTMSGGTISDNRAFLGGGVCVLAGHGTGGTFIMSGGNISGNTADRGGGVMVDDGTFQMAGGTITGSTGINGLDPNNIGVGKTGVALFVLGVSTTAEYGTVDAAGDWNGANGPLVTTDDTIRVVGGVLNPTP
jgi:PHD/YefM family antitoxin component YafN of YafNO toxin-antitoxin module